MALSEKHLSEMNSYCTCGRPCLLFTKHYMWKENHIQYMEAAGKFMFCDNAACPFYFKTFITPDTVKRNCMGELFYYTLKGLALDFLPNT